MRRRPCGYSSAGTFEFLMDAQNNLYFIEANTRLQVEHGVTELVTGIDIVKEQIRIAAGEPLSFSQEDVTITGHAIECRVNAENPDTFAPSPGRVEAFSLPGGPGIRVDTFVHAEAIVPPNYDSLIAKVMSHGRDSRRGHRPHAARARDDGDRGHPDVGADAPEDPGRRGLPAGADLDGVHGAVPCRAQDGDDAGHAPAA